jgi:hypothetical protein
MSINLPNPTLPEWVKLLNTYDPAYYMPGKLVTAEEWNTLFLAGVNQGNYLANTLDKLIKEYLPETFVAKVDFITYTNTIAAELQSLHEQDRILQSNIDTVQTLAQEALFNSHLALNTAESAVEKSIEAVNKSEQAVDAANTAIDNSETAIALSDAAVKIAQEALDTINYDTLPVYIRVGV